MIGIMGGYGDIGKEVVSILQSYYPGNIKTGGRKYSHLQKNTNGILQQYIDVGEADSIYEFASDCDILVNCTGCRQEFSKRAAQICMEKGCHYVDVNKNEWLSDQERASTSNYMLHNAGSLPGISGLLPSYAAGCFDTADSVELYYMASGEFSNTAANDYVQGLCGGTTKGMVKYQDGTCVPAFLDAGNAYMPVFNREFKVFPYLDAEAMHCIETMKLVRGSWFMAYEKGYTLAILEKINCASYVNDTKIAEKVCTASKLDCKVNGQYAGIIIQAEGYQGGEKRVKTLIIKYDSPALFTGSAVAAAIISVLERKIESGIYMLSETFKGQQIINVLKEIATYSTFVMEDGKLDEALAEKEGEL